MAVKASRRLPAHPSRHCETKDIAMTSFFSADNWFLFVTIAGMLAFAAMLGFVTVEDRIRHR